MLDPALFERFTRNGFIKVSDRPTVLACSSEKVRLNRKGNELFNIGEVEKARRVFQTTGYSDGLIRVGEWYLAKRRPIDAMKMFVLANDQKRSAELFEKAALVIQKLLGAEEQNERPQPTGTA